MERKSQRLKSQELMIQLIDANYGEVKQARERGIKTVYAAGHAPTDLAVAMGFLPIYPENHATMCGAAQVGTELCQVAEEHDYCLDLCSYAKNDLGSILAGTQTKSPIGGLPKPDILMATTMCNSHERWFKELSRIWDVPLLLLDVPFVHDGLDEEDRAALVQYALRQLKDGWIPFFEDYCHRPYDWDKLQECMSYTSEAGKLYSEALNSTRHIPSPVTSFDIFLLVGALMNLRGFPEASTCYELLNAEIAERINQGFSPVGEEKYRLYWDNIPVWYRVGALARKFSSYGACLVAAIYPITWVEIFGGEDPSRPLESIAEVQSLFCMNRGTQFRIDMLTKMVEDYSLDGLVMQMSRTCKAYIPNQLAIMHETQKRTGIPAVVLEGDMVDSRFYSDAEVNSR